MTVFQSDVSIIICAYTLDRWQDICEAIESARKQDPAPKEIILVSDYNRELEERAKAAFPDAVVVSNQEAQGLSGARNSGIAVARGKVVAFLDDDAIADKHWTAYLLAECEKSGIVGATARVEPLWIGQRPRWFPDEFLWVVGCSYRGLPKQRQEVRNLSGGACGLHRDLSKRSGGFNSLLGRKKGKVPISCEETEFCIRTRQILPDAKFVFQPAAVIHHKVPAARLTWSYFTLRCYAEGLSKAYLAKLVGTGRGLSSERSYVLRTLSSGVLKGLGDAIVHFEVGGLGRSAAIIWGLSCASVGYLIGHVRFRPEEPKHAAPPVNVAHLNVEAAD